VAPTEFSGANTVRGVLKTVDQFDLDTVEAPTAPDVRFRFSNADPTETTSERSAAAQSSRAAIAGIHHGLVDIPEIGYGTVVAILDVHYRRLNGRELNLLCRNVFRVSDGLVRDFRSYLDVNPVISGGGLVGVGEAVGRSIRFSLVSVQVAVLAAALALYGVNPNFTLTV
jgi:ketosteroid isomerase-like protein